MPKGFIKWLCWASFESAVLRKATKKEPIHMNTTSNRLVLAPLALGAMLLASPAAHAYKFDSLNLLASQAEFKLLAEDLTGALAFKPMSPAEGLGVVGFDISASVGGTSLRSREVLKRAAGNSDDVPDTLPTASVRIQKGLPLDIDIGAAYTVIPGTSASAVSGEIKWAFTSGGTVTPALAVRAFYTRMSGLGDMKLQSQGLDLSISKGFVMATPYAGVGVVGSKASTESGRWAKESYTQGRVFAGVNLNFALLNLAFEADKTGENTSVGMKAGWRF
jgi:hypothetical protein